MDSTDLTIGYVSINPPADFYQGVLSKKGIHLYVIPRNIVSPITYIVQLTKIAKGYDIIHVHGNSATMVLEMIAAKLAKVRIRIAHSHNTSCSMKWIDRLSRPLFYHLCNLRLACSTLAGIWLYGNRCFDVVNNGINVDKYIFDGETRLRMKKDLAIESHKVVGHVGNFVVAKNHQFIIRVFKSLSDSNPDVKLLLVGDGPLRPDIENLVFSLGLTERVLFAGSVENVSDYMQAMDVVLMPSVFEGFPLTLVEEQANGLQCLVSDSITRDVNLTGLIHFKPLGNEDEWAKEVILLLDRAKRDSLRSENAIKCIQRAGYDIKRVSQNLKNIYLRCST